MPNRQAKKRKWQRKKRHEDIKKRKREMRKLKKARESQRYGQNISISFIANRM